MDQGRGRGRALHGIGEPDAQRKLRTLSQSPNEEGQGDHRGKGGSWRQHPLGPGEDLAEGETAEGGPDQEEPQQEPGIPHPIHDESLVGGIAGAPPLVPEADEEVGAQPHPLPAHEEQEVIVRQDEHQHGKQEQVEIREVPGVPGVAVHVPDGIHVDQEGDHGHRQHHHRGERVHQEADRDLESSRHDPGVQGHFARAARKDQKGDQEGNQAGEAGGRNRHPVGPVPEVPLAEEAIDDGPQQGEARDQPDQLHVVLCAPRLPEYTCGPGSRVTGVPEKWEPSCAVYTSPGGRENSKRPASRRGGNAGHRMCYRPTDAATRPSPQLPSGLAPLRRPPTPTQRHTQ